MDETMHTFILELGTKDSPILFRRLGSNLRQLRADMVMVRSNSNLFSIEVMKDSAPTRKIIQARAIFLFH